MSLIFTYVFFYKLFYQPNLTFPSAAYVVLLTSLLKFLHYTLNSFEHKSRSNQSILPNNVEKAIKTNHYKQKPIKPRHLVIFRSIKRRFKRLVWKGNRRNAREVLGLLIRLTGLLFLVLVVVCWASRTRIRSGVWIDRASLYTYVLLAFSLGESFKLIHRFKPPCCLNCFVGEHFSS